MDALVVRGTESGTFLDRVVAHAVHHKILSESRRRRLSKQCAEYFPAFCKTLNADEIAVNPKGGGISRLNLQSTKDALEVSRYIENLISIGLEVKSSGSLALAAEILANESPVNIIELALARIRALRQRVLRLDRQSAGAFELQDKRIAFGEVIVVYTRLPREIPGAKPPLSDLDFGISYRALHLRGVLEHVSTTEDLSGAETLAERWDGELRASLKFLPWGELKRIFGQKSVAFGFPSPDFDKSEAVEPTYKWDLAMLLSTLSVTLQLEGRAYGKVFVSEEVFRHFAPRIGTKRFKERALAAAREYLASRRPRPDDSDMALLLELWDWSLGQLAHEPRPKGLDWALERVILTQGNRARQRPRERPSLEPGTLSEEVLRYTPEQLQNPKVAKRVLGRVNWHLLRGAKDAVEVEKLWLPKEKAGMGLPMAQVISHLSPASPIIRLFVQRWGAWTDKEKRLLIGHLVRNAPPAFWQGLPVSLAMKLQYVQRAVNPWHLKRLQRLLPAKFVRKFQNKILKRGQQTLRDMRSGKSMEEIQDRKRE